MNTRDTFHMEFSGVLKAGATWADAAAFLWRAGEQILDDVRMANQSPDRSLGAGLNERADECYRADIQTDGAVVSWGTLQIVRIPGTMGAPPARRAQGMGR